MIALLRGRPLHREPARCVVDVGGVGYEIFATNRAMDAWFQSPEPEVTVHVSTQVREDAIALYGFQDAAERGVFSLLLTTVSGVGPKVALSTLEAMTVPELARAVETDDIARLSRINGVGKKTAQRLALELKGKIAAPMPLPGPKKKPVTDGDPLPLALERLGYTRAEIARALEELAAKGVAPDAPVAERLRAALGSLYRS